MRGAIGLSDYTGGQWFFRFLVRCIRFFTKSKWSHTFTIIVHDFTVGSIVEEAGPLGVAAVSLDKYIDGPFIVRLWFPLTAKEYIDKGILRVWPMMGKSYGYFQLLGFVLVWLWYKITLRKANNPIHGGIICSELVLEYLQAVFPKNEELKAMDKNTTSPEDIHAFIVAHPELFEEVLIPKV